MSWNKTKGNVIVASVTVISMLAWLTQAGPAKERRYFTLNTFKNILIPDTISQDSIRNLQYQRSRRPTYRPSDRVGDPFSNRSSSSPLLLGTPSNVKLNVEMDDSLRFFEINETMGDLDYRNPSTMTYQEYSRFQQQQAIRNYWRTKASGLDGESVISSKRLIPKIYISPAFDRIFGGNYVDIRPNGNVTLRFGYRFNNTENPTLPTRLQKRGDFDFDQNITLNLIGNIGEKLKLTFNWDTKANFDFENNMKLDYTGYEEEIIRKIEAGNVSLPLNNSLIQGGQNLFGVKTQMQFGRLSVTTIGAQVRGRADEVVLKNGSLSRDFEIRVDEYERDRHYFLSQFFRNRYDRALANLPLINSGIVIRRLEVYITNDNRSTENLRNIVTLMDLGETDPFQQSLATGPPTGPVRNDANRLNTLLTDASYRDNNTIDGRLKDDFILDKAVDFEHVLARRLDPREYKFNPQLGYISLNSSLLPQQVLGVAFEYTFNGKTYKVGELQDDYQNVQENQVIFMKMLKSTNPALDLPTWDLMMKNVYSLNSSQINREKFQLNIVYKDDESGVDITSLQDPGVLQGIPLVDVFNLDNVNTNNDPPKDGNFDFLPGVTIDPETGKIYFPQVEPFGTFLEKKLASHPNLQEKYVFHELYDSTQTDAQQVATKAKFFLKGRFQAEATDEIPLPGIGVAEGSVRVYSGGTLLQEDVHYRVDYAMSRVKIIDPSYLNSANDLRIELEKQELLQIQPRQLLGARFDYQFSNDVNLGGTVMHFIERPFVNRVNIGDEPTNNTIYGLDFSYRKDSRVLTKMVDYLPLIQTKAPSSVTFNAEFAQLLPGQSKLTGEDGASYIDDFETAESPQTIAGYSNFNWKLAATPTPLQMDGPPLETTYNRGRIAWYSIDQLFFTTGSRLPSNISSNDIKNHYVRGVIRQEVFPNRNRETGTGFEYTFDVAYYPNEKGQYNYNPAATPDGKFIPSVDPKKNWGGISRDISFDTDFDNANIEYIEFWLMDPFIGGARGQVIHDNTPGTNNDTGGKLFINLGNISEDVLQDGRYEFENGLPTNDQKTNVVQTPYGYASTLQFLTDAFDNQSGSRRFQDIGIDGVNDAEEKAFFPALANFDDPAGDNFQHYLNNNYDDSKTGVLGRYKKFNGMEGNSPANSTQAYSVLPDKEDLNRDNIISDVEQYYEYGLDLRPQNMEIGQNYIVDKVENTIHGDKVTWYQFRIPVRQPTGNVGGIRGFKSIRFMRMYLTDFEQPVVLRFVQFQFVANQWRKFIPDISQGGPCPGNCNDIVRNFTVSTVNIEENGQPVPGTTPYVVPPGIKRQRDFASNVPRVQNEQALQICVEDLRDSFSKAVYKNITTDMLIYKRLKMFLHAQAPVVDGVRASLQDGEVNAFIRLGTDYTQNYYEYTIPLKVTPQGTEDINEIWPRENMVDVAFEDFVNVKLQRNREGRSPLEPYSVTLADGKIITVVGNPDFSMVQGVMIGIQNPRSGDGLRKSVCIWANELRVLDFNKTAGWAATARLNTKLADFANVTATGSYTTFGFGGIQQKVAQRARENTAAADINTNVALDKFIPEKVGMKIPMTVQYGTLVQTPRYDPLDGDVELKKSLTKFDNDDERDSYRKEIIDQTTTKSINFINVRKEKTNPQAKNRPYDIENLSLTGGYSERLHTNVITDRDFTKAYMGAVAYTYNATPKNYTPLINAKVVQSPYLRPVKDLNLTPLPSRFAFRADIDRRYNELQLQARSGVRGLPTTQGIEPTYQKYFFFNRLYDLKWDLTKSLTFDYTATNRAVVDEPDGKIDADDPTLKYKNEIIWENLKKMGRNTSFNQLGAFTYRLPLDKFPLTDWVSADARYGAGYTWSSGSTALISDTLNLGNTIQNNTEKSVTGKIDMVRLYNKVKFLKAINSPPPRPVAGRPLARPGAPAPALKPGEKAPKDTTKGPELKALKAVLRAVMTARSINFRYSQNEGTLLPGYLPRTKFFGFNEGFSAPGLPFIVGHQYSLDSLYNLADSKGWYTDSSHLLNTPLSSLRTRTFSASTALEPFKNFNIQLESRQNRSDINEVFYKLPVDDFGKPISEREDRQNPIHTGSFSTSFISVATLFESGKDNRSPAFESFIDNRQVVRDKLSADNPLSDTEHRYELNSQDVLIPSFLHAYQGKSISSFETKMLKGDNMFKMFPLPNWRVDYNGLSEIEMFKKYFSSVTLSHAYSNTFNISSFTTSLEYQEQPAGLATQTNQSGEFIPYYIVNQVAIVERMAPVVGINVRTKNKITARVEYKTERSIALNMTNAQVTQSGVKDYVIGLGYNTNNFRIPFRIGGENKVLKNDLTMRMDLTLRDNTTIQRTIVEDTSNPGQETSLNQVTNGSLQLMIRPTIDYVVNQRLNLQLYFNRNVSQPRVQNAYRNTMTEGGVQLRFSLGQ